MNTRTELRKMVRSRRQELTAQQQKIASAHVKQNLITNNNIINARRIATYLSNDSELDILSFIHWCWQQNKEVYLPVLHPFSTGHLLFLRYKKNTPMTKNKYGILEPVLDVSQVCPLNQLDVLFTPLVAFDSSGTRLGMGGGFYDRTMANWYKEKKAGTTHVKTIKFHAIGLAHDCQQVDKIPTEIWDIPLAEIITPSKNYYF